MMADDTPVPVRIRRKRTLRFDETIPPVGDEYPLVRRSNHACAPLVTRLKLPTHLPKGATLHITHVPSAVEIPVALEMDIDPTGWTERTRVVLVSNPISTERTDVSMALKTLSTVENHGSCPSVGRVQLKFEVGFGIRH
jgi:hypothetical protein